MKTKILFLFILFCMVFGVAEEASAVVLFEENFEDTNFASRGWYDSTSPRLSTTEHIQGSTRSIEYRFLKGGISPVSGGTTSRKKFSETDRVYVSYWVKYSTNWTGSNRPYHPHEFLILTNKNGAWDGPSYSHLTAYIEQNEGKPILGIQDGMNIDESKIGTDLTNITENRSVAGCNGSSDGYLTDCYAASPSEHRNGKTWYANSIYFKDVVGAYYKSDWHHIEAYFQMNSIVGGKGINNGQVKYWYDNELLINHENVLFRTAQNADMRFNQFLIGPWIGDGSPVEQTFWVDNLVVATAREGQTGGGGGEQSDTNAPAIPIGITVY